MAQTSSSHSIQTCNLFGDASDLPDVVHCETIATRSILHEWEFSPHRHPRLHQFLLIESGGGEARLEGRSHPLRPMRVVNVPVGHVHGFTFTPGTQGWVVTVAAEVLDEVLIPAEGLRRVLVHSAVARGTSRMRQVMQQIFAEFAGRDFARAHLLRASTAALIGLVAREMVGEAPVPAGSVKADLFQRFESLLEQHFLEHWTVADYARALAVTPAHLSRVTRAGTGHGASQLILDRIVREARRNLVYTSLPISTIAYSLGFNDPAYFSRLFSGATGRSPRSFRDNIHQGS